MIKTICDRCGTEIKNKDNEKEESFILKQSNYDEDKEDEYFDLCPDCFKELKLFLNAAWK